MEQYVLISSGFLTMGGNLSHRHLDICTSANIRRVRCRSNEDKTIVECHSHPLSPAFSDTNVFPFRLIRETYLDDVAKQGDLCMAAMVNHPFDAKLLVMASNKCFAQLTQQTSMPGTTIAESKA